MRQMGQNEQGLVYFERLCLKQDIGDLKIPMAL